MTIEEIREDLKEIRLYYGMQKTFEMGEKYAAPSVVAEKVKRYNSAIVKAPAKMYILYVNLYLCNNSQTTLSEDWGYTPNYVKDLNNLLINYFLTEFNK